MTLRSTYGARFPMVLGFCALVLLVGGVGFWSVRAEIAGAVIASGVVMVENNRQVVQHAEGGTVGHVAVRDGDLVATGDLLIQLDDRPLRSDLAVVELQLIELKARRARLEAERDENEMVLDLTGFDATEAKDQVDGQRRLFDARRQTLAQELSQISERILQAGNQIMGTEARLMALSMQAELTHAELQLQESALSRGLTQSARVSQLRREHARLVGEIGHVKADIARFKGEIAGFEIERVRLRNRRKEGAISELRDIAFRELELQERRQILVERLSRLDVRAPVGGVVHGSTVFGRNAVVRAAEVLMYVIPQDQPLIVTAKIPAIHVDEVYLGQRAMLRFSSFNQRITPDVSGTVTFISADVIRDEWSGADFYRVDLAPLDKDLSRLSKHNLVPGMPVETFLRTSDRTPLSYLTKPLTDYFERAFREG